MSRRLPVSENSQVQQSQVQKKQVQQSDFYGNWHYPTSIRAGIGRINELPLACKELGMNAPLVVTDPALAA